jgi:RNA polymerase sigma-70 factor (ECF subfamily)
VVDGQRTKEQLVDQRTISALAAGDPDALETLYDLYAGIALAVISRMIRDRRVAEELVQELFLRVWQHAGNYQHDRGQVRSWILGIAHNLALNELRSQRRRPLAADPPTAATSEDPEYDPMANMPDPGAGPDQVAWLRDRRRHLAGAIEQLPPAQRAVLELYGAGHSQSEIARSLDEPLGTVKSRMRRGLQLLRDSVSELEQDRE